MDCIKQFEQLLKNYLWYFTYKQKVSPDYTLLFDIFTKIQRYVIVRLKIMLMSRKDYIEI